MKLAVYKTSGEETGRTVELRDDVFAISPNDHAIYLDVKQFMANKRQGTHKSKERNEIQGSSKKIKKQKHKCLVVVGGAHPTIFPECLLYSPNRK